MEVHAELCCLPTAGKWKRGRGRKQERLGAGEKETERRREGEKGRGTTEAGEEARVRQSSRDWILSHYYVTFLTKASLKEV